MFLLRFISFIYIQSTVSQCKRVVSIVVSQSTVWKDTSYLLVCYEPGLCSLHTAKPNQPLRFRHIIRYRGISVDAKFFTQAHQLYLIIANNADKFPVPSV